MPAKTFTLSRKRLLKQLVKELFFLGAALLLIYVFIKFNPAEASGLIFLWVLIRILPKGYLIANAPRFAISTDASGIWQTRRGRENGYLLWEDATKIRHVNGKWQEGCALNDGQGNEIHLCNALTDSLTLFGIVKDNAALEEQAHFENELEHFHVLIFAGMLLILLIMFGSRTLQDFSWYHFLGFTWIIGGMGFIITTYLTSPYKIVLSDTDLHIQYPLRRKSVKYTDIRTATLISSRILDSPIVQLTLAAHNAPVKLNIGNISEVALLKNIERKSAKG